MSSCPLNPGLSTESKTVYGRVGGPKISFNHHGGKLKLGSRTASVVKKENSFEPVSDFKSRE